MNDIKSFQMMMKIKTKEVLWQKIRTGAIRNAFCPIRDRKSYYIFGGCCYFVLSISDFSYCSVNDRPSIIYLDGTKKWIQNKRYHRVNLPAIVRPDGSQWWYRNGKIHRDCQDGPAAILYNAKNKRLEGEYFENGQYQDKWEVLENY